MITFERRDPFPLLPLGGFSKSEAQAHAAAADRWLGLRVEEIEERLRTAGSRAAARSSSGAHQQLWFGLEPRDLQTPYLELRSILEAVVPRRLSLPQTASALVVDLGCAYARMAFVIERHFPEAKFRGYEYVGERVREAQGALTRFGSKRSSVEHADLTSPAFVLPRADVYFIYDYGTPAAIEKTLYDLHRVLRESGQPATIVARGRVCRYAIESRHGFWLRRSDVSAPERAFTIYESHLGVDRVEAPVQDGVEIIDRAHHA